LSLILFNYISADPRHPRSIEKFVAVPVLYAQLKTDQKAHRPM